MSLGCQIELFEICSAFGMQNFVWLRKPQHKSISKYEWENEQVCTQDKVVNDIKGHIGLY